MDNIFKKYFAASLLRWGENFQNIDFDKVTNLESLCDQLGIIDELCYKPPELLEELKTLFSLYEKGIHPSTKFREVRFPFSNPEWEESELSQEEKMIEKFWSEDPSKYVMGNRDPLHGKQLVEENFTIAIASEIEFYKPQLKEAVPNIEKLKRRLKKSKFNFDLARFDEQKYESEIVKIIYFFFDLENKRIPKFLRSIGVKNTKEYFNVLLFLSKPTMESVDFSFLGWDTCNGKITKFIKYPLEKELGLRNVELIQDYLDAVESTWLNRILQMRYAIEQGERIDFQYKIEEIQTALNRQQNVPEDKIIPVSPIKALYLRISQFERLGELNTFLDLNRYKFIADYNVPPQYMERMKKWKTKNIKVSEAEKFVKQNFSEIAKYVYLKGSITNNELDRMRENMGKIPLLLECCKRANPNVIANEEVTVLRIISCLQAILIDKKDNFKYNFYLLEKYFKHPQTDILKNDGHIVDAVKLYWVRRINNHFNANLGEYEMRYKLEQYENEIYKVICKLFSCTSIKEMQTMNIALASDISPRQLPGFPGYPLL